MAAMSMAARANRRESLNTQELRLALAMRGGVSLCVWIGGAVAEIDRLRRFDPDTPYRRLAELAGYTGVKVDVLAGASAGGLNGVIYGAAQAHGFDFATMRDLWIRLADIADLSRSPFSSVDEGLAGPPRHGRRPPSLLRGDGYFLARLESELTRLTESGRADEGVDHLDVILSVTRWAPEPVRSFDNRFAPIDESRSAAYFHFRHRPGRSDLTAPGAVQRLARAARTTSSFPAAFEPARLDFDGAGNLTGVFTPPPEAGTTSLFAIDGGVLDNIPVTAAVEAIAAAPASGATDRWLLYLHPSPGRSSGTGSGTASTASSGNGTASSGNGTASTGPGGANDTVGDRPRAVAVVQRFLAARLDQESLLTDIDELDALNAELAAQRLRRKGLLGPLSATATAATDKGADPNAAVAKAALSQWKAQRPTLLPIRARIDAGRLVEVLERPDEVLVGTPNLAAGHTAAAQPANGAAQPPNGGERPVRYGRPTEQWGPLRSLLLPTLSSVLELDYERNVDTAFADAESVVAAADVVLGLAHWLQRFVRGGDGALGEAKLAAYAVRAEAATRVSVASRVWPEAAAAQPVDGPAGLDRAYALTAWALATVTRWRDETASGDLWARLAEATDSIRDALGSVDDAVAQAGWTGDRMDRSQQARVAEAATEVGGYDAALRAVQQTEIDAAHRALLGARPAQTTRVLQALAGLLTPLRASRVAPTPPISFLRLGGTNPCPIGDLLPGLFGDADVNGPLDAGTKLCGDELGNFAAFLSAKWRANDWMWGRLDAVVSLVDLLVDARRLYVFATVDLDPADHEALDIARDELIGQLAMLADSPVNPRPGDTIRGEVTELFARPNDLHLLPLTRRLLARRLQWEVLQAELPRVESEGEDPPNDPVPSGKQPQRRGERRAADPAKSPAGRDGPLSPTDPRLARYAVGRESAYDLSQDRLATIAMRLALVALRVVKPANRLARHGALGNRLRATAMRTALLTTLSALKPVYLMVAFTAASPRRARLVAAISWAAMTGAIKRRPRVWPGWPWNPGWPAGTMVVWALLLSGALCVFGWCATSLRREFVKAAAVRTNPLQRLGVPAVRRELIGVGMLALGLVGNVTARPGAHQWRTALIAASAGLLIWGGGFWMRPKFRWALAAVGVLPYLAGAALRVHDVGGGPGWLEALARVALRGWPIALVLVAAAALQALLRWIGDPYDERPARLWLSPRIGAALAIAALWTMALWAVATTKRSADQFAARLNEALTVNDRAELLSASDSTWSFGVSGWALLALAVAAVAQTVIITYWDVLPPRPSDARQRRPTPGETAEPRIDLAGALSAGEAASSESVPATG